MLAPPVAKTKPKTTSAAESNRVLKAPRPSPGPGLSNQAMLRLVGSKSDHARHAGSGHSGPSAVPPLVHDVLRSPGRPLDPATRSFMEPRFGQDFGQVRLHTDERAAESARAVNASAYAAGRHLVFGAGRYSPATAPGRRLLAHELAHSIQQGFAPNPRPRLVDDPRHALERQADDAADGVIEKAAQPSVGDTTPMGSTVQTALLQRKVEVPEILPTSRLRDYTGLMELMYDPSKLTDAQIEATNEFKSYMDSKLPWQWKHHMTKEEALLACRLILRRLREGKLVDWWAEAAEFMMRARRQLGTLRETEKLEGELQHTHLTAQQVADPRLDDPNVVESEFATWMLTGGPEPTNVSSMNCWEMVLFGAFRGGFMRKAEIQRIYRAARDRYLRSGGSLKLSDIIEKELCGVTSRIIFAPNPSPSVTSSTISPEPLPGDIVTFDDFETHVAISLGTKTIGGDHLVMSLHKGTVQKTTIEAFISGPSTFYDPRFIAFDPITGQHQAMPSPVTGRAVVLKPTVKLCRDPWRGK